MNTTRTAGEEKLIAYCEGIIASLPEFERSLLEGRTNERFASLGNWYVLEQFALKAYFIDKDISLAKLLFYNCGIIDELLINKYDEKILHYGINHLSYALLSDNQALIRRYADLTDSQYKALIQNGRAAPMYALQCLIKEDWREFERVMFIINAKSVPKLIMALDASFYVALAERNKAKMEEVISELVSTKVHTRRNKHHIMGGEFLSHPAVGYTKLAWIKGIEVQIDNPLVPMELMPVKPLESYRQVDLLTEFKR